MVRVLHATKQHMLGSSKCFLHTSHKTIRQFYDVSRHRRGEDNRRKYCSFDFHINWRRHFRCTMHCAIRSSHCLRSAAGIWAWFCVALDAWTVKNVSTVGPKELQARHMSTNHNFAHGKMATSSVSFFFCANRNIIVYALTKDKPFYACRSNSATTHCSPPKMDTKTSKNRVDSGMAVRPIRVWEVKRKRKSFWAD